MVAPSIVVTGVPLTRENFRQPPLEMGILPFWFWNGDMDEREMEWQLREYREKGITGVFIHGRFGLTIPYASDAWFDKVRVAVELARKVGIQAWVYDEMNWPSGTAERKVPSQFPHLTQKYLELVALNVDGPLFTFLEATDNRYVNTGDSYPVAAFGCTEDEYQHGVRNPIDLTQNLSFEKVLPWEAPAGKWRLLYFLQKEVPYYIDTLNPESTERFLELTHDRYKGAVGKDFGSLVPGFYTDEPAMHYYHVGIDNFVVPWTSQMFKIFRERRGYDLRPYLPALYLDMGPRTPHVRYDFWRTLTEQYAETYFGRIRRWCEENGVLFTGHLLFEEWIRMHARCEGNLFRYLEKMHIIGVDHLYPKIGTPQEPDQHVALKIGSSAAHHFGSTRLLCESMGGAYWDCSLERMKWIADWEYVLGVNLFNNHGYHYSIEGERKRDWPPSQFYHHTWWKYYSRFTEYMARVSHMLSGGRHVAKLLVLYPLNSIWTNYVPQERTQIGNVIESEFNFLTDTLLRLHYDFDYVDEDVLANSEAKDGSIRIRDEEYEVLILPPITHIKKSAFDLIARFVRSGGTVIADTLLPLEFLETSGDAAPKKVEKIFGVDPRKMLSQFTSGGDPQLKVKQKIDRGTAVRVEGKGLHRSNGKAVLRRILRAVVTPDVTISDEEIFYLHRVKDGFDIYFFVNTSHEAKRGVEITFEREGKPELWDPTAGSISPIHVYRKVRGRLSVTLDFGPVDSHVIVLTGDVAGHYVSDANLAVEEVTDEQVAGYGSPSGRSATATIVNGRKKVRVAAPRKKPLPPLKLPRTWGFALEGDNSLLLTKWKMVVEANGSNFRRYAAADADERGWLDVTHGAWEMQLPQERDISEYPVNVWYRTSFEAAHIPQDLRVLIDGFSGSGHTLFVNGKEIADPGRRSALDAEMNEVDIHGSVCEGMNSIAVRLTVTRRTDGIIDPLKLIGSFTLDPHRDGYRINRFQESLTTGDWTKFGYPFFSGTGVYSGEFTVPKRYVGGKLFLAVECGDDVLDVRINGGEAMVAVWHPYTIDVTDRVCPGLNRIEIRITNTLINQLEGVRRASGLLVPPRLQHFHRYILTTR